MDSEQVKAEIIDDPKKLDFSFNDFVNSKKPYDYVAQYRNDDFKFMQEIERVNQIAIKCGIRTYKSLLKKYMEVEHPHHKSIYNNTTEFTDQPLELSCGIYYCSDSGISFDNGRGEYNVEVCSHPIMPVQRLVNIDDNTEKLKIAYRKGDKWREIVVDREIIASANKIVALSKHGVAVNSENAKYLVKFLADIEAQNFDIFEELISVGRLGWINGKVFSPYVDDLVYDGGENYRTLFNSVHVHGSFKTWLSMAQSVRAEKNSVVARITLATSFASVLVKKCGCLPFILHLWGGSGAGKTVAEMFAASVWANSEMGDYIHSFNSTNVAQELYANFVNSLPLIIDELQIIKDKKSFDNLIYQLTEGVGRARGQKSGGLQKVGTWRNCIITSGEFPINNANSGGGAVNRVIEIDCADIHIFENPQEVLSVIKNNYGGAGRVFVEVLGYEDVDSKLYSRQQELMKDLLDNNDITDKQAASASLILLADELTEREFFQDGIRLSPNDLLPYLKTKTQVDQNRRCLNFLNDYISANSDRFDDTKAIMGETWGVSEFETVYIIKTIFERILRDNGFNATAFLSWAKIKGLIKVSQGHNTVLKRINGHPCRCVALVIESVTDEIESDNSVINDNEFETIEDEDLPF